jgi:hypothetical protein
LAELLFMPPLISTGKLCGVTSIAAAPARSSASAGDAIQLIDAIVASPIKKRKQHLFIVATPRP